MVAGIIILYHPDFSLLDRLIRSVLGQVEMMVVVDNTPGSSMGSAQYFDQYAAPITYIPLGDNTGIAFAQNVGINKGLDAGASHILLLDQDSAIPEGMVRKLLAAEASLIAKGELVAAVGPVFLDEKTNSHSYAIRNSYLRVRKVSIDLSSDCPVESDHLIASGSLISANSLNAVGPMKEELFIDLVDIEWGLRARRAGYKCFICPTTVMLHSIGDTTANILWKTINLHGDVRNYYIVRNAVYLLRISHMGWRWRLTTIPKVPQSILIYSWCSDHRLKSLKLLLVAFRDGIRGRLGRLD